MARDQREHSPTMTDVAALSGFSIATVSHVINGTRSVRPSTAQKVNQAIQELGFIRNRAASQLRSGRSDAFGLIVLDASNPYFMFLARGAEDRLGVGHGVLMLGSSEGDPARERMLMREFFERDVRGVIITPSATTTENLLELNQHGVPVVRMTDRWDNADAFTVGLDDEAGGRMAVEHLLERGCRRILMVNGSKNLRHCQARWTGAQEASRAAEACTLDVVWRENGAGELTELVSGFIQQHPDTDGIFCVNDATALTVLKAMRELGRSVPGDTAIIGYDDLPYASELMPPLTTVHQPIRKMGWTAMDLLLRQGDASNRNGLAAEERHVLFTPELIVRESA